MLSAAHQEDLFCSAFCVSYSNSEHKKEDMGISQHLEFLWEVCQSLTKNYRYYKHYKCLYSDIH